MWYDDISSRHTRRTLSLPRQLSYHRSFRRGQSFTRASCPPSASFHTLLTRLEYMPGRQRRSGKPDSGIDARYLYEDFKQLGRLRRASWGYSLLFIEDIIYDSYLWKHIYRYTGIQICRDHSNSFCQMISHLWMLVYSSLVSLFRYCWFCCRSLLVFC